MKHEAHKNMQSLHPAYLKRLNHLEKLSREDEVYSVKKWKEDSDPSHLKRLVEGHLHLVSKIAVGYRGYGLCVDDLMSEGHIGIMNALKNFDPDRGFRFSTYATWWIKSAIHDYIFNMYCMFKVGTNKKNRHMFFNLRKTKEKIRKEHQDKTPEEQFDLLAEALNVSKEELSYMDTRLHFRESSLNVSNSDNESEWIEWISDHKDSIENQLINKEEEKESLKNLHESMNGLNKREFQIIKNRYLIEPPLTLQNLSETLKISGERVRQIEKKALNKLKQNLKYVC
jgi:RNA polymerase sigma-32 factor